MDLERAHGESNEAGVAGWISSNDVALLGAVIGVVMLLLVQSNYLEEEEHGKTLQAELATLQTVQENLQSSKDTLRDELKLTRSELQQRDQQLRRTQAERDAASLHRTNLHGQLHQVQAGHAQTQSVLAATESSLAKTESTLAATESTLAKTESTLARVQAARADLTQRVAGMEQELTQTNASLAEMNAAFAAMTAEKNSLDQQLLGAKKERDQLDASLRQVKADSQKQQNAAAEEMAVTQKQLADLQAARNSLQAIVDALELKLTDTSDSLDKSREQIDDLAKNREGLAALFDKLRTTLAQTRVEANATEEELNDALRRLESTNVERGQLLARNLAMQRQLAELQHRLLAYKEAYDTVNTRLAATKEQEKKINQELVGIRGGLKKVAILVDASGSMQQQDRWAMVREIVGAWLTHFDVDECVLIIFNGEANAFPAVGTLRVAGPSGPVNRQWLIDQLASKRPGGWTNTLAALHKAYAVEHLDSILLFTDGNPSSADSAAYNDEHVAAIFALVEQTSDRRIPINTIGLGDDAPELSAFLRTLARRTGGTFLGR
ncbi:hypothetical protein [Lignipirellula cremea]|uniref:Chromosome partition protein Smc n=1 Tax=Lignipirellula cremea TaxID=2528010 RepID=A0A518E1B9_9BACT|nr:hypothetical protein [Lignipirellula cremea]QDU97888.1 Chromosome partition protein Smc [Lignipirellula cremea]